MIVGAVYSGIRLEGVLTGRVRRDGVNATRQISRMVARSRFFDHLQVILLQGIALAGFNVVDIGALHKQLGRAVMVVVRRLPDQEAVRRALIEKVPGGSSKWRLVEQAGPIEPIAGLYVQRVGLDADDAAGLIRRLAINSDVPEPLRTAHMIASGVTLGESRHRV
jgi:endonuclease V-like protein UPF0215 family